MPRHVKAALVFLGCTAASMTAFGQVRADYDQGAGALLRELQRLQTTASVLHTGAHPDDEDSALVAYNARRDHARTAYLSLTRGSGGQNIIGTEQSDLLGIIRTEELLQARRLDGAEQLFTRAVDYGFSKYREEAARLWKEEIVLADMVRAIRTFRPDVMVSTWTGTAADGHGHHQFAGYLTPLAVEAAASAAFMPEAMDSGLAPWSVKKVYVLRRRAGSGTGAEGMTINTGTHDPVSGRTYFQIGMRGRSQQKTQQMGSLELFGRQESTLVLAHPEVDSGDSESGMFDGIDTSISGIAKYEDRPTRDLTRGLQRLEVLAESALESYEPLRPASVLSDLSQALVLARRLRNLATSPDAVRLLDEKVAGLSRSMVLAAGVTVDALAGSETVIPGGELQVAVRVFAPENGSVGIDRVALESPGGWRSGQVQADGLENEVRQRRRERATSQTIFEVVVPADAKPSEPYWLARPHDGFTHDWSAAGPAANEPFGAPLLMARVDLRIAGEPVAVTREVMYRFADPVRGEVRRRIDVVPRVSVRAANGLVIIPASATGKSVEARLSVNNHGKEAVSGRLEIELPVGWQAAPSSVNFDLPGAPSGTSAVFEISLPDGAGPARYRLSPVAHVGGTEFRRTMEKVAYEHIRTHRNYERAAIDVEVVDVNVAPVRVGYVMGSGDRIPEALQRLGLEVSLLDDGMLASGDLSAFDTIVVGIRASQTRPAFVANHGRMLDFARNGGALIVQYQQRDFIDKGLAPFPASMGDRTVRVVDETAPVRILQPAHPVFSFPNPISADDFDGWVQERNNYNFATFDETRYLPLTESHDEGDPESYGAMLYANIGRGHYVYTGYSWFRQLPNGVPGAYRIFANLVSLPAAPR